jgi:hypothetical protein
MPSAKPAPENRRPKKQASEKRLAANRANSSKSTGPNTESGKAAIGQNALRHGLTAQVAILPSEDRAAHETFCQALIADLAPATGLELNLAQSIADDMWRLNRARALENNIFAVGLSEGDPDPDPDHDPAMQIALNGARTFMDNAAKFGLLSLYEQRIHRTMHKNLALLRQTQAERKEMQSKEIQNGEMQRKEIQRQEMERAHQDSTATAPRPIAIKAFAPRTPQNAFDFANNISEHETLAKSPCKVIPMSPGLGKDHKNEPVDLPMAKAA